MFSPVCEGNNLVIAKLLRKVNCKKGSIELTQQLHEIYAKNRFNIMNGASMESKMDTSITSFFNKNRCVSKIMYVKN